MIKIANKLSVDFLKIKINDTLSFGVKWLDLLIERNHLPIAVTPGDQNVTVESGSNKIYMYQDQRQVAP